MDTRAVRPVVSPAAATRSALRGFEAAPAKERRATAPFWMVVRGTCVGYLCSGLCVCSWGGEGEKVKYSGCPGEQETCRGM